MLAEVEAFAETYTGPAAAVVAPEVKKRLSGWGAGRVPAKPRIFDVLPLALQAGKC